MTFSNHKIWMLGLAITLCGVFCSGTASATVYECAPKQAIVWKNGKLEPEGKVRHPWIKSLVRFDSESSTIWTGIAPDGPMSPLKMEIFQQPTPGNDLVAIYTGIVNGQFIGNETLTIRGWDKKSGLVFLLTTSDEVVSGKCVESQ